MSTAEVTREGSAPVDALAWLRATLWATDADVDLVPVPAGDPRATWLARPAAGSPELLVPLASHRAAAGVSRRFWDGMTAGQRARQWLGEAALRSGVAQRLWPRRVALVGPDADRSLLTVLAAEIGADVLVAITARPTHYNAKPILALFDPAGAPLAFAKVAVDDISEHYVRTEVEWLQRAASAPPPLRAPRLLAAPEWQGRPVALCEPLRLPRLPRRRPGWGLAETAAAVTELGEVVDAPLGERGPVVRARAVGDEDLTELADLVAEAHGDAVLRFGAWHGDLTPWNTASQGGRLLVWDWEMAGEDMPVGSDLLHARLMVATHLRATTSADALAAVDPRDPATAAYLLEMVRRDRQAQRAGRVDGHHGYGAAAAARLRRGLR